MDPTNQKPDSLPAAASDPADELRMPMWQHLDELRGAVIRVLLVLCALVFVCFNYSEPVVTFLERPLLDVLPPGDRQLYFTGIADKFFIYIKVSMVVALAIASPYLLFEVWRFVSPGLYAHERRLVLPFIFFGTVAFVGGMLFSYYVVMPYSFAFLINFGSGTDKAIITLTSYFSLAIKLVLGLGLVFELPVCMVLLGVLGVIEPGTLEKYRRYAVLGIAVLSAVITPTPDVVTMLIVMAPLYLLYELSIVGVRLTARKKDA